MALNSQQLREAGRRVAAWRAKPQALPACPVCGAEGLMIIDRSARPHAEWYALSCASCGLDETIHIALGAAVPSLE